MIKEKSSRVLIKEVSDVAKIGLEQRRGGHVKCELELNLEIKSGIWRVQSTKRVILRSAALGGRGAVLFAFTLCSVRWKDDGRVIKEDQTDVLKTSDDGRTLFLFFFFSYEEQYSVGVLCFQIPYISSPIKVC